jgi:quinol monooxygenase YgiN
MFAVTFKLLGKPEKLLEINQSLEEISQKVKKLEGCIDTRVYQDTSDKSIFYFVEEWQKQGQLDDHMKSSLFAALLGIKGLLVKEPEIKFMAEN